MDDESNQPKLGWVLAAYTAMIGATIVLYLLISSYGDRLAAPAPTQGQPLFTGGGAHVKVDEMLHVLLALVAIIVLARGLGALFRRFHQPPVIGEIIAGIMLGPSLLGRISPTAAEYLIPHSIAPFINVLAQVGVILYMFLVGLELDPGLLRRRGHATVAISHASITVPFILGALLSLIIYPILSTSDVPFTPFSLFVGVSMSVTAFPVLARIMTDRGIHKTRMGAIALTCAAINDVTAWCLLAFVVEVVQSRGTGALLSSALAVAYILLMLFAVRPLMGRLALVYGNRGRMTQGVMATVFVALLLSAFATDFIGIHAVFGAFAIGAIIPHDSSLARDLTDRLEDVVVVLLLPAFFAFTGLRTQIGLVNNGAEWMLCALIIVIASLGKFSGSALAARVTGLGWRDASALGILMNTRGLMELIVLNIGLELRIISPTLFAMLVLMALVTTFATTPILQFITRKPEFEADAGLRAPRPKLVRQRRGILVPISNPQGVAPLLDLALAAMEPDDPPPHVIALVHRPPGGIRSGLRELEQRVFPRPPILFSALDYAERRKASISAQSIWTEDPASDIVRIANEKQTEWILLGSHRPVFGADFRGGVVSEVLRGVEGTNTQVGIVIGGVDRMVERVYAIADGSIDSAAAIELAARIARRRKCSLHALLVPVEGGEPDHVLLESIKELGRSLGRWLHTDVLAQRDAAQIAAQTRDALLIIGTNLVEELGLPTQRRLRPQQQIVIVKGTPPAPAQSGDIANEASQA